MSARGAIIRPRKWIQGSLDRKFDRARDNKRASARVFTVAREYAPACIVDDSSPSKRNTSGSRARQKRARSKKKRSLFLRGSRISQTFEMWQVTPEISRRLYHCDCERTLNLSAYREKRRLSRRYRKLVSIRYLPSMSYRLVSRLVIDVTNVHLTCRRYRE